MSRYARQLIIALPVLLFSAQSFSQVEEITVSAQRRDANLQEVPISVSAFTVDDMEKLQINAVGDVAAAVPNMKTYNVTANGSAMQLFMRGTGVQNPGFNTSESPVGLYVDDVYHGRLATANLDLTDVERTEVLRGPQGTLYGRNTLAGAMKFITRTPGDEMWGNASLGYGNYKTSKATASVGGPLIDGKLAASVTGLYHNRDDGWIKRSEGGDALSEYTNKAVRGKLHWYGGDIFDAQLSVAYIDDENDGYNGIPYGPSVKDPASVPGSPLNGFYDTAVSDANKGYGETDQFNTALTLAWNFGAWNLKSITSYSDIDDKFGFDLNGGATQGVSGGPITEGSPFSTFVSSDSDNTTVTQEIIFSGDALEDSFHWTAGLFYLNEDGDQEYSPSFGGLGLTESSETETNSYAVYGQGGWDITEKFSLTLGARLTRDEKDYDNDCSGFCDFGGSAAWSISQDETFTEFNPTLLLEYRFNKNFLMFGSTGSGFKSGGFQSLCLGVQSCAGNSYDTEDVWNSEIGIKSEWLDNRLRFNASTWYAQYSSIQQTVVDTSNNTFPLVNAGDADILGLDIETYWSPNDNWDLFAIFGYQNDSSNDFDDIPGLAETSARLGFNWSTPTVYSDKWEFSIGFDVEYSDEYLAALAQEPNDEIMIDDYTRLNGTIVLSQFDGPWSIVLNAKNITDEDDNYSGIASSATGTPATVSGINIRTPQPPREYMMTVKYAF